MDMQMERKLVFPQGEQVRKMDPTSPRLERICLSITYNLQSHKYVPMNQGNRVCHRQHLLSIDIQIIFHTTNYFPIYFYPLLSEEWFSHPHLQENHPGSELHRFPPKDLEFG